MKENPVLMENQAQSPPHIGTIPVTMVTGMLCFHSNQLFVTVGD